MIIKLIIYIVHACFFSMWISGWFFAISKFSCIDIGGYCCFCYAKFVAAKFQRFFCSLPFGWLFNSGVLGGLASSVGDALNSGGMVI